MSSVTLFLTRARSEPAIILEMLDTCHTVPHCHYKCDRKIKLTVILKKLVKLIEVEILIPDKHILINLPIQN